MAGLALSHPKTSPEVPDELGLGDSQGRASVMETRGAQVEGFSPFRTTGYSGQVSCKGTKLMIYPLSPKALKELLNVKHVLL